MEQIILVLAVGSSIVTVFLGCTIALLAFRCLLHAEKAQENLKGNVLGTLDTVERLAEKVYGTALTLRDHSLERSKRHNVGGPLIPDPGVVQYSGIPLVDPDQMQGDLGGGPQVVGYNRG
jgi:hypothetical protein